MESNWLDGVRAECYLKCNNLTLHLIGQPDPTYDCAVTDASHDRPLEKLRSIFSQIEKGEVKVAQLVCKSHCIVDDCGCIHCMLECLINGDVRNIGRG